MADIEIGRLSAPVSPVNPADVVMSPDGTRLYVAGEDGKLRVYDVASRALLSTWDVGVRLGGIDVSADGSFLLVVEKEIVSVEPAGGNHDSRTTITVYRVDTASGQAVSFPTTIERAGGSGPFHDVAILADGTALLSHEPMAHPLRTLDLATGVYSGSGVWHAERGVLVASRDRGEALFAPTNVSNAPLHIYTAGQGITHGTDSSNGYPYGVVAFSEEADLVVRHLYSVQPTTGTVFTNLHVYNASLEYQFDLIGLHPEWADGRIAGLAFDADGANLFVLDEETNRIVQLRTSDWATIRTFEVGGDVTGTADGDYGNRLLVSPDGRYFTVVTGGDLRIVENDALPNVFAGTAGADTLDGGAGDDQLSGVDGDDSLVGGSGNDRLDGGIGADGMRGGTGNDVYAVDNAGDAVVENAGEGTDRIETGLAVYSLGALPNVENLTATSAVSHDFRGNSGNNVIAGNSGNDFIRFHDGGNDTGIGGGGNDVFLFGSSMDGLDAADGGSGTDQIALQGGAGFMFGSGVVGIESIGLLSGSDTRFGGPGGLLHSYSLATVDENVAAGAQLVVDGAKLLAGENLTFNGFQETDGSFFIYGGRGFDHLTGGARNDVFLFGSDNHFGALDVVDGSDGIDQLALRGNYSLTFGIDQLNSIESIGLLSAHDTRFGPLGSNYSYNLTTHDNNVGAGVMMTVDGAKLRGTETLVFNGSAETDGSFRLFGGINGDTLTGGQGADILQGHGGADMLTGGGGTDTFRYASVSDSSGSAFDRILDFAAGTDKVDLTRIDADSLIEGNQAFSFIGSNGFSGSAGQLRAYEQNGSWFVEGDTNGDGNADLVIQLGVTGGPLSQGDFLP